MAVIPFSRLHFGNGAGTVKDMHGVIEAGRGPATRIMVGSMTYARREGNIGQTYHFESRGKWSANSLGLPNMGLDVYRQVLPSMVETAHRYDKELWASVAGFTPRENAEMTLACLECGVDGVELNLSCPNVWGTGGRKAIPALDPEMFVKTLVTVRDRIGFQPKPIAVKLSPTSDMGLLRDIASNIEASEFVTHVTACNTIPDQEPLRHVTDGGGYALAFRSSETDTEVKHKGGLAGSAVKAISLGVVRTLRERLSLRIHITGVGGIFTAQDALDYLKAGASAFQCTTAYYEWGNHAFHPILSGLADILPETV